MAIRHGVPMVVVSNSGHRLPTHPLVSQVVVADGFDAADDWIVAEANGATVVVTGDILLANRCLKAGATVLAHNGRPFTPASIGGAVATRAIMADLRAGMMGPGGGLPPFAAADRSRFLSALDAALVRIARRC